ncbi:protein Aster-B-like [Littorina saxatilis]|uniref:protein Aster-B-like n=1 Tax=Littorina saxatilis TaxID=31220 RepID=UPI0038B5B4AD
MSRQGKRGVVTVEYQRTYVDTERGSPANREAKHKQSVLFHVESSPAVSSVVESPKSSPRFTSLRGQRDTLMSSQESINVSSMSGQGDTQAVSALEPFKEGEVVFRHGSPVNDRSDVRRSGSPEKSLPGSERNSQSEMTSTLPVVGSTLTFELPSHSASTPVLPSLADSMSDSTSERDRTRTLQRTRERSFERSLDNILDKCSEKSLDLNLSVDSWNGTLSEGGSRSIDVMPTSKGSKGDKKKKGSWYTMLSPTYKSRSEDFRKTFKEIPRDERLIVDYSCAMQKDILVQGRMYISQNWVCFYANIFRWETVLAIPCRDITAITKERTARVIPNAIQITTTSDKYFFTSFGARDKTYMMLFRIWQNNLMNQPMPPRELWQWIHYNYGEELGLGSSDDDYVPPPRMEDLQEKLKPDEDLNQKLTMQDLTDSSDHPIANDGMAGPSNEDTDALVSDEVFNQSPSPLTAPILPSASSPPTDYGDTTEDSDSEVPCSGHEHLEKLYLDEVFNLNADKVFENLFTDSAFFRVFVGSRKTFDLNLPQWEDEPDEDGNRVRNISYTLTLNNSIGPRTSPSTERQVCYKDSKPGKAYIVDCEICNGGIPYGDSFYVVLRYCLTRISLTKCRIRVTSELRFRKSVMGMFKSMIEKSAVNGLTDYFRSLSAHFRREAERQESHLPSHPLSKKKLRRRRKPHASVSDNMVQARSAVDRQTSSVPPSPVRGAGLKEDGMIKLNADTLVRVIIIILILLVVFNALLFYKLWAIEASTTGFYSFFSDQEIDNLVQHPRSQEDWAQLLRKQRSLHDDELSKWKEILHTSVELLDQMKGSLLALQGSLEHRTQSPPDSSS